MAIDDPGEDVGQIFERIDIRSTYRSQSVRRWWPNVRRRHRNSVTQQLPASGDRAGFGSERLISSGLRDHCRFGRDLAIAGRCEQVS
jgi:hypothetical protein